MGSGCGKYANKDPAAVIGKKMAGKDLKPPTEQKEYVMMSTGVIVALAASSPYNLWMLCNIPNKLIIDPSGNVEMKALCGGSPYQGKLADFDNVSVVAGTCMGGCTCCEKYAIQFNLSDEGLAAFKAKGCGCCRSAQNTFGMVDIDRFMEDFGLLA